MGVKAKDKPVMHLDECPVLRHDEVNDSCRVLVFKSGRIAREARPGQFVHLRVPMMEHALLRRPFSIYRVDGNTVSILYKVVGKGTRRMMDIPANATVSVLGPLGNGFPKPGTDSVPALVGGGYGVAPLSFLASRSEVKGVVFIGAENKDAVFCADDFRRLGWTVKIATMDGSEGSRGLVTDAVAAWIDKEGADIIPEFFVCGPDGLLKAMAGIAGPRGWRAWLSLDKHMGCGVGACLACVQRVRMPDGSIVWKRVCREGPVFAAADIVW